MKKAALTFGLFSLIMVATSFVTPEKTKTSVAANIEISIGVDGGQGTPKRKGDLAYDTSNHKNLAASKLNSFNLNSQFTTSKVKVD
ncbi:hypothetical protein CLU81_2368 [Flavobacterium sp. 9]|uniref:hypothetical protein n=1 Tax=Flavobacterium sp. 9 TaxID=2035198 RepID=UPI000C19F521|nr:hypothetical protein [Flavobacterium sp. 9]PIF31860.1 hypothetical protein CLU81_2368 [Flavobacterium sp. 9]